MINIKKYITDLINKSFNTDKGIYYFVDLIKEKYPTFKIDEDNLKTLSIVEMPIEYFYETGFVGEYVISRNEIKIVKRETIKDFNIYFSDKEIIDTFLHELLHVLTSKIDKENRLILEGLNLKRIDDNNNSFFLGINEGITQYLTNDLLRIVNNDAYTFETNIAEQISLIIGKDFLIDCYSNNDVNAFLEKLKSLNKDLDLMNFIQIIYAISVVLRNNNLNKEDYIYVNQIQEELIKLYLNSGRIDDKRFSDLILIDELKVLISKSNQKK